MHNTKKCLYFVFTVKNDMRKNPKVVEKRRSFVKEEIAKRHKSETVEMCISRIARKLFLSNDTIWKDYLS